MNIGNTRYNVTLFRRELNKLQLESQDRRSVESFNWGRGFYDSKSYTMLVGIYVVVSLIATAFGKGDIGLGIIMGSLYPVILLIRNYRREATDRATANSIIHTLEEAEANFASVFTGFEEIKQEAREQFKDSGMAYQYVLDWARKEVILVARKVKGGNQASNDEFKIKVAAGIIMFGKSFDRGQKHNLFFDEKIVSEMRYFKEELRFFPN